MQCPKCGAEMHIGSPQAEREKVLDKIIAHCRERAKEWPDDETYTDSEMDLLVEWIEEELRQEGKP